MTPTAISSSTAAHQAVDAASVTSPTPEQQKAARDFEAIFLRQLMASLEKGSGLGGQSSGGQVFRSMMVSALADTASAGGGIGMSELILKAMLPPTPGGKPDLSSHVAAPALDARTGVDDSHAAAAATSAGISDPSVSAHWGTPSRVLTEARRGPMLGIGTAEAFREGNGP